MSAKDLKAILTLCRCIVTTGIVTLRKLLFAAACVAVLQTATGATAEVYPSRPIIMVVPLSVGGSTDVIGRLMAEGMRKVLHQTIIVENTSGAGGTIGVGRIVHAPPDGYT